MEYNQQIEKNNIVHNKAMDAMKEKTEKEVFLLLFFSFLILIIMKMQYIYYNKIIDISNERKMIEIRKSNIGKRRIISEYGIIKLKKDKKQLEMKLLILEIILMTK